jgi:predicted dithiol-disulfide oxidoreductase (DUF899 family)
MNDTAATAEPDDVAQLEQQITEVQHKLVAARKRQGGETLKDYAFKTPAGDVALSALFAEKRDLLVVHNMGRHCPYCTLWADGFAGLVSTWKPARHSSSLASDDPVDVQQAFAQSRGWPFRMVSSADTSFFTDMRFRGPSVDGRTMNWPGVSAFRKSDDGTITLTARSFFGPGDAFCPVWHLFDLLADGANEWRPKISYTAKT